MGTATITATYAGKTVKIVVSVDIPTKLTTINKEIKLAIGATSKETLTAIYAGDNNSYDVSDKAAWSSLNSEIAEVNNGLITGVAEGTTTITVVYGTSTLKIVVKVGLTDNLEANVSLLTMFVSDSEQITLTAIDENNNPKIVTNEAKWTSSSLSIADVKKGLVKALNKGKATITATYGGQKITIAIEIDQISRIEASDLSVSLKSGESANIKVV